MKRFLIGSAVIALLAVNPASAQLLGSGGGLGGGLGGQIGGTLGGGLGGGLGGANGALGGTLNGTVDRTTAAAAQARQAARLQKKIDARNRKAELGGSLTGTTAVDGATNVAGRSFAGGGTVDNNLAGRVSIDGNMVRTRGAVAAAQRGLKRVSQTASGVAVFAPAGAISAPTVVRRVIATPYPIYDRNLYYGGSDVVFIPGGEVDSYMDRQYRDLERGVQGTGVTVVKRGTDLVLQLPADVTFAFDKSDIQPRFVGALNAVAQSLDQYRGTDVEVVGHTDSVGSDAYNLALSERRGRSVADFFVAHDTRPDRLVVEAMGESEPIASNATIQGRAANRRVEIVLHPRTA